MSEIEKRAKAWQAIADIEREARHQLSNPRCEEPGFTASVSLHPVVWLAVLNELPKLGQLR